MTTVAYKTIVEKAKVIKNGVEKQYKLIGSHKWAYYMAKAILTPNKAITVITIDDSAPVNKGDYISTQIYKKDFIACAKKFVNYVEKNKRLSWTITGWENRKIGLRDYTYMFSKILVWYDTHKQLPNYNNINSKAFTKPTEYPEKVYNMFVKKFGKFDNTVDGALAKVDGNGYSGYSDDYYNNENSINRMANGNGINCTDSCHVFMNIFKHLIKLGKYKKVECLHVQCSSGTGHVRLRIQLNTGDWIYRDPASVLDGNGVTSNWCISNYTYWATNPDWFMENLQR